MRFANPIFLAVAAGAAVLLIALFVLLAHARRRALARIGSSRLLPELTASLSRRRRLFRQGAVVLGTVLLGTALARPQLGYRWEEAHRRGVDLLFAIDTSKSMLTRDVKPNRLERAKLAVRSLVEKFPGNRVGLVAFAGTAFVETPLTLDHGIFDESVASLDTHVIPLGGTDIARAIDQADKALAGDAHRKVLVLITDGEDLAGEAVDAAQRAAKDGVVIYTLGVGTPKGELVPEPGPRGQTQFVRDERGALVTSRLDEALLGKIARASGGDYRRLGDGGQGLESLYDDELSKLPQSDLASRSVRVPIERYQWPLAAGLLLLGIEPLVNERKRRRSVHLGSAAMSRAAAAVGAVAVMCVAPAAAASPQSAQRAYEKGDYTAAEEQYAAAAKAAPGDARLDFDLGAAAYRKGDFAHAGHEFESALRSEDLGIQEHAYYNLGDASFRLGEATLAKDDVEATKGHWKQSIDAYEGATRLRPDDADAQFNLELVKRRLAALEKKQEEQTPQDQPKQNSGQGSRAQDKAQNQKQNGDKGHQEQKPGTGQKPQDQGPNGNKGPQGQPRGAGPNPLDQSQNGDSGQQAPRPVTGQDRQDRGANGDKDPQGPKVGAASAGRAGPGELSKADAESLLDSMRSELRLTRGAPVDKKQVPQNQEPVKDW